MSLTSELVGSAGLYAAAYQMASLGWLVSPTFGNAPRTDLLAQHAEDASRETAAIHVKTRTSGDFHLDVSDASPPKANEWVILVSLPRTRGEQPDFCVVPRNHVCTLVCVLAAILANQNKPWPRKLIGKQEFKDYRDRWDLMRAPAGKAPWWLPEWVFEGLHLALPFDDLAPALARSPGP